MSARQTQRARKRMREQRRAAQEMYTADDVGIALRQTGRGTLRLTWDVDDHADLALFGVSRMHAVVDEIARELILQLRSDGLSWADIGDLLDVTGEAVRKRWYEVDEELREAVGDDDQ